MNGCGPNHCGYSCSKDKSVCFNTLVSLLMSLTRYKAVWDWFVVNASCYSSMPVQQCDHESLWLRVAKADIQQKVHKVSLRFEISYRMQKVWCIGIRNWIQCLWLCKCNKVSLMLVQMLDTVYLRNKRSNRRADFPNAIINCIKRANFIFGPHNREIWIEKSLFCDLGVETSNLDFESH